MTLETAERLLLLMRKREKLKNELNRFNREKQRMKVIYLDDLGPGIDSYMLDPEIFAAPAIFGCYEEVITQNIITVEAEIAAL